VLLGHIAVGLVDVFPASSALPPVSSQQRTATGRQAILGKSQEALRCYGRLWSGFA